MLHVPPKTIEDWEAMAGVGKGCGAGESVWRRRISGEDLKGWVRAIAPVNKR